MFQFLFKSRKAPEKPESHRERFERLILELNEVIDSLPDKPAVTVQPGSGRISFTLPSQFMDEALALPKPDPAPAATPATPAPAKPATDAATPYVKADAAVKATQTKDVQAPEAPSGDQAAKSKRKPSAPVPRPPKASPPKPSAKA